MKGLTFRRTAETIAAFVKQHGAGAPRRAIFCTYDIDPARFEAVVLPELARPRRWFRTMVLADGAALQKQGVLGRRSGASRYELAPVRLKGPGVFHPKMIAVQAGPCMLIGIGSGNLTAGGLGGNLELMLFATNEGAEGNALAGSGLEFLHDLLESRRVILPASAKRFVERFCLSASRIASGPVLHNLHEPLLGQLAAGRPHRVARVAVVSPWHSTAAGTDGIEPAVLSAIRKTLGAPPIVFTQGKGGKAPSLDGATAVRILRSGVWDGGEDLDVNSDVAGDDGPRRPARLHAKAYVAVGERDATMWFGSANCTKPALQQPAGKGNVELLVRVALDRKALARFDADLNTMFESARGQFGPAATPRIPLPRGRILAGQVDRWDGSSKLTIELAVPAGVAGKVRIGTSPRAEGMVELSVPPGVTELVVAREMTSQLFRDDEVPPMLWEHIAGAPVPFPVSVPCVPAIGDVEETLQDALDDLAGRTPLPFRTSKQRGNGEPEDDGDLDERDHELELLTKSKHEGKLDRIAVLVELLRRRVKAIDSPETRAHYARLIKRFTIPAALRTVLSRHLVGWRNSL